MEFQQRTGTDTRSSKSSTIGEATVDGHRDPLNCSRSSTSTTHNLTAAASGNKQTTREQSDQTTRNLASLDSTVPNVGQRRIQSSCHTFICGQPCKNYGSPLHCGLGVLEAGHERFTLLEETAVGTGSAPRLPQARDMDDEWEDEESPTTPPPEIDFCTLGMFIIDEIHYLPPKPPVYNVLGGAGSFSALGARLFSPPPISKSVSWIVDKGSDFPATIGSQIEEWETSCVLRSDEKRLTTRGWNGYGSDQHRAFKYTTPKLRLDEHSLTFPLLFSKSFHLICSPTRCINLIEAIIRKRRALQPGVEKPLFIWEPVPDLCTPDELLNCTNALPYVDVCSPNQSELAGFLGEQDLCLTASGDVDKAAVERASEQLLSSMPLRSYALVVRCGKSGCYIAKNGGRSRSKSVKKRRPVRKKGGLTLDMDMEALFAGLLIDNGEIEREREEIEIDPGVEKWIPAYYQDVDGGAEGRHESSASVVDPTGGGNGFLGGLAISLARGKSIEEAAAWGTVAASFTIEQVGVPTLGQDEKGNETWNGVIVEERLKEFTKRIGLE